MRKAKTLLFFKYMKKSKYKVNDHLYRCECGREFNNSQSLNAHLSHCKFHHEKTNKEMKLRPQEINKTMAGWDKFNEREKKLIFEKMTQTLRYKFRTGKLVSPQKNKPLSEETKTKQRVSMLRHIEEECQQHITPRYSKKAIQYIEKLNEEKGWHLQHAENGGEKFVNGYWVDGYDKNLNIVFEYDEPHHYKNIEQNILKEKDLLRQHYIINTLKCEFYRYNEYLDLFYKVQ